MIMVAGHFGLAAGVKSWAPHLYYRSATGLPSAQGSQRRRAFTASAVTTALLLLASDVLGL